MERLCFPAGRFRDRRPPTFEEWFATLTAYGAQGNPTGQAHWGLKADSPTKSFMRCPRRSRRTSPSFRLTRRFALCTCPQSIRFSWRFPPRESCGRRNFVDDRRDCPCGFARGTALAMVLSQYGLGFFPKRTPGGSLVLSCVAAEYDQHLWPIGWDRPEGTLPAKIGPPLRSNARRAQGPETG